MLIRPQFQSKQHEAAFRSGAKKTQRGAAGAAICGARARIGAECLNAPIREGNGRCLAHAGPKAANAFHARKKQAFESGRITAAEWNRAEARRAANRLGDQWKTNPWLPGSTIDLGEHDGNFRDAVSALALDALPPAVVDWLRWRYRRTQIDRPNSASWYKALTQDLQRRIEHAGPRPTGTAYSEYNFASAPRTWAVSETDTTNSSRRALPDTPRAPKIIRGKGYTRPGRPRTQPADENEFDDLMRVYRENTAVLEQLMSAARSEAKQLAVLRTLRDYLARPADVQACKRWLELVEAAQVR